MSDNRGIFSLEEFYNLQVSGETTNVFEVFRYVSSVGVPENSGGPAYAYAAGGFPGPNTIIDRIDYANDTPTASPKGNLSSAKGWGEATGNTSYAYVGGGNPDGTKVDRVDYASDTSTASPKGNLSQARYYLSAAGNTSYGWWAGGAVGGGEGSTIDRKDYASDTTTNSVRGTLTVAKRLYASGTGNLSYGYFSGGATTNSGGYVSTVERVEYSNDSSTASPKGPLTSATGYSSATGNSDYGYVGGGSPASTPNRSTIDRIDFGNDTATTLARSNLPYSGGYGTATGSSNFGYWIGSSSNKSQVNRLDYSNDTAQTVTKGPLSANKYSPAGSFSAQAEGLSSPATLPVPATRSESGLVAGGNDFGYNAGGRTPGSTDWTNVDRLDFANDTNTMATKGPLSIKRSYAAALTSVSHGYAAGNFASNTGHPSPGPTVEKIDYANDTAVGTITALMASYGYYRSGSSNKSYGWVSGGPAWNGVTTVERLDWSNDSATSSPRGNLNVSRHHPMAVGNMSYGYHYGGQNGPSSPSYLSSVSRIDYSNDSATASPKGPLTAVTRSGATTGAGNADYGYADKIGGYPSSYTTLNRIDYSNDTATALPKGTKSTSPNSYLNCTVSNPEYGWWIGGYASPPSSIVMRITFANDTAAAQPKGNTSFGRGYTTCHSARMHGFNTGYIPGTKTVDRGAEGYTVAGPLGPAYGYFSGGFNPSNSPAHPSTVYYSNVDRVDFASDTSTASPRGKLDQARANAAAAGSLSHGYIGATDLTSGYTTIVARVDYANDSATAVVKGSMNPGINRWQAVTSNTSYAWFSGGQPTASTVQRIDFGNDTATASVKGSLSLARQSHGGAGNADYGWHAGGYNWPAPDYIRSVVDRIDYSNDSVTATPKGPLSQTRSRGSATGNTSYGYFVGGEGNNDNGLSTVDRIDFSSDTPTAATKGPLTYSARGYSGFSAQANALAGPQSFIPRIRWVDSVAEVPASSLAPAFGYFHGGNPGYTKTRIDRLDYSNDTDVCVAKGPLSVGRSNHASASNKDYGYWAGGYVWPAGPHPKSYVDRMDYANDTPTTSPKGPISYARYYLGGTGNASYAYFGGGVPHGSATSYVDRIDYGNDTATASPKGNLSFTVKKQGVTGNPSFGYYGGGTNGSAYFTTMNRIDYSNDTATATVKGPVSIARQLLTATGNTSFGYFIGGDGPSIPSNNSSWVDRLDYSNDTTAASVKGYLSAGTNDAGATGSPNFGYAGGGDTGPTSTLHRIDYSNDSATALARTTLGSTFYSQRAVSGQENGLLPTATIAAPVQPPFPLPVQLPPPVPNPYGYVVGGSGNGDPSGNTNNNPAQRIDFTNDTATALVKAAPANPPGDRHYYSSATSNRDFAYSCMAGTRTYIQRLDYSNDSANFLIKGHRYTGFSNASSNYGGYNEAATGNLSYGYWNGGYKNYSSPVDPSVCPNGYIQAYSHIDRIDYSNDTANSLRRSYTTTKRGGGAAAGTNEHGYWIGNGANQCSGSYAGTIVERTDYASDTTNASVRGNLNTSTDGGRAAGNKDYAWLSGRSWHHTNVERIDYANDTATASIKGPLSAGRTYHQATGNQDYGYACGTHDFSLSYKSIVERIDYSNDTATGSPKGPLAYATSYGGGTSATLNNNGGTVPA